MKTIDWTDLPAIALEVIDEVERTGERVLVTKDGIPAMRIEPVGPADLQT
jgi:antitoxin (DNA-binding transcriptional repressor) of toxin-antitoxin stability system